MNQNEDRNPELAYEPPDQGVEPEAGDTETRKPEEIEREIERTRGRMSENIDELENRLSPQNLKAQAKTAIQDAAGNAVQSVGEQAQRTGSRILDMIRENPLPVIAVGAAATWLLTKRPSHGPVSGDRMARYAYSGPERRSGQGWQHAGGITGRAGVVVSEARESVSDVASGVSERTRELRTQVRRRSARVRSNLEHAIEENPLVVAAGAAVLGLAMGLLLPGTEREDEMLGPTRDRLVDRAGAVTERVKDATVQAGREVAEAVQDQIEEHKPELKEVAQETAQNIKEQVKSSAKRVKAEAKEAARQPDKADLSE
jgi:ElaB/YqjD/DUF883 family membrane-anchored ribosome-binding protein